MFSLFISPLLFDRFILSPVQRFVNRVETKKVRPRSTQADLFLLFVFLKLSDCGERKHGQRYQIDYADRHYHSFRKIKAEHVVERNYQ
jgi:hypothetical protein